MVVAAPAGPRIPPRLFAGMSTPGSIDVDHRARNDVPFPMLRRQEEGGRQMICRHRKNIDISVSKR